ncbi:MAG: hypothetical protein ACLSVG_02935 [Clostridia bacterium]
MKRKLLSLIILFGLILPCALPAKAASMSAFIDVDAYVEVGAEFKVVARYEADAEAMVRAVLYYDSSVVTFVRSKSSDAHDEGGKINIVPLSFQTTHKIELYFKMNAEAPAVFSTQVLESSTIDLVSLGTPVAERTVTGFYPTPAPITPSPTPEPTPTPTPFIPTIDPNATPSTPLEFLENGEMRFIAENFSEEAVQIPEGFEKIKYSYKNNDLFVLKNAHGVILLYATNIVGENGKFYIYNEKKDILTPYTAFVQGGNTYTFLLASEGLPAEFKETAVKIGTYESVTAYTIPDSKYADFVLVYAFNKTEAPAFYLYDLKEGTLQRCIDVALFGGKIETSPSVSPSPTVQQSPAPSASLAKTDANSKNGISNRTLMLILVGLCFLAAVAAVIIIIVRSRRISRSYETEDNDVEYLEDVIPPKAPDETTEDTEEDTEDTPDAGPEAETDQDSEPQEEENKAEKDADDDEDILHLNNRFPH